ncbi:MAG TPA: glycosyl hydrolase family 79 C-terminal domain-containing protein [Ktedonosporobacter sp.]|nr:glycosyl hydrolase family 79 C-terminal domain-containing protein [Ktedonosporobacter sp.]
MSHRNLFAKLLRKQFLWFALACLVIMSSVILYNREFAANAAAPPPGHRGSPHAIASLPNQAPDVSAPTASQGSPLNLTIDSTQDTALATDAAQSTNTNGTISLRNGFASISLETSHICNYVIDATQAKLAVLLKNFGTGGIIRVGGGSVDSTDWDGQSTRPCPTANLEDTPTMTPPMIRKLFNFAHSIGWKVIWSVGLQLTPAQAADDAASALSIANSIAPGNASPLLAIAIGNEPEIDITNPDGSNPTYAQFRTIWETDATAIKARVPTATFSAPDTCCTDNDQWFLDFMKDDGGKVQIAANHLYPTNADNNPTIGQILSPTLMQDMMSTIDHLHQAAAAQHLPLLMSETNSIANSPTPAVGLSFGQSLWAGDYLFSAQEHGVIGLNFHGGIPGDATSPTHGDGQVLNVQATYYGMLLFHQAVASGGHVLPIKSFNPGNLNVTAHAIRGRDGKLYVAIFNKGTQDVNLLVASGRIFPQQAKALRLTAPSVQSQSGFQLGGAAVGSDGTWTANHYDQLPVLGNVAAVSVPAYSAALVIFEPHG